MKKYSLLTFFGRYFLVLSILLGIFWAKDKFFPAKNIEKTDFFLNMNSKLADSVLKTLSLEEKIALIFPYKSEKTLNFINLYDFNEHFLSDSADFPTKYSLEAIFNDTLLNETAKFLSENFKILNGQNLTLPSMEVPYFQDFNYRKHWLNRTSIFLRNFQKQNILTGVEINISLDSKQDSALLIECFKPLINQKLAFVLADENYFLLKNVKTKLSTSQFLEKHLKFIGLFAAKVFYEEQNFDKKLKNLLNTSVDIVFSNHLSEVYKIVAKLVKTNQVSLSRINQKVKRILLAKQWSDKKSPNNLKINDLEKILLFRKILENSLTLVKNDEKIVPLTQLHKKLFGIIYVGDFSLPHFEKYFNLYDSVQIFRFSKENLKKRNIFSFPKEINVIALIINDIEIDSAEINFLTKTLQKNNLRAKIIAINFGNPLKIKNLQKISTILQVYNHSLSEQQFAAQILFGGSAAKGKFPIFIEKNIAFSQGFETNISRLKYTLPEESGFSSEVLQKIDSTIFDAIAREAFPSCQVFVAKAGEVFYHKSFGKPTYESVEKSKLTNIYDLASITKIFAATISAMKMVDKGNISLDDELEKFFKNTEIDYKNIKTDTIIRRDTLKIKDFKKLTLKMDTFHLNDSLLVSVDTLIFTVTPRLNIFKVKLRDLLRHESGITPSLPILRYILSPKSKDFLLYFSTSKLKDSAEIEITKNLYFRQKYFDTLWADIKRFRVYSQKIFQYIDVNMILLQQAIDSVNNKNLNEFLFENFYEQLGLQNTTYLPLKRFRKHRIIPTALDKYWRQEVLQGYVHDESAAFLGGISGNAGLFSNANDLGIISQMLLNKGIYGGERYLSPQIVEIFTKQQENSKRGLGFDRYWLKNTNVECYGHSGFTGNYVWIDEKNELIFIFLSNRIYPNVKNWKLISLKINEKLLKIVHSAKK